MEWRWSGSNLAWTCMMGHGAKLGQGARIGWIAGPDLFLDAPVSCQIAQRVAGDQRLTVSELALRHRMRGQGFLASVDAGRQMLLVPYTPSRVIPGKYFI